MQKQQLFSKNAEAGVLAACMLQDEMAHQIIHLVKPEDFYLHEHKTIASIIWSLLKENKSADILSVDQRWEARDPKNNRAHKSALLNLHDLTFALSHWREYVRIVLEYSAQRTLLSCSAIVSNASSIPQEDFDEYVRRSQLEMTAAIEKAQAAATSIRQMYEPKRIAC